MHKEKGFTQSSQRRKGKGAKEKVLIALARCFARKVEK
jgi:hypothetical protein